jgi:cytochrome c6
MMTRTLRSAVALLLFGALAALALPAPVLGAGAEKGGEALFKEHCAVCHPDGGNIVNPKKTLSNKDREANKVRTAEDVVTLMRKPGPGMSAFDQKTISDKDAGEIARYILKTFNK